MAGKTVRDPHTRSTYRKNTLRPIGRTGRSPLPYATIHMPGKALGTTTNEDSRFQLRSLFPDTTRISLSYVGYQKKKVVVNASIYRKQLNNLNSWKLELEEDLANPFNQNGKGRYQILNTCPRNPAYLLF